MKDEKKYYDARQHLNLSAFAYDVVEFDKYEFLEKPSDRMMINRIFEMYSTYADADIGSACDAYQEELEEKLQDLSSKIETQQVIAALCEAYRQDLIRTANAYPREHAFKVQLTRENYNYISNWKDPEMAYNCVPGNFIKAVIEEYARKPYVEREKIIFRNLIETVVSCVTEKRALVITLRDHKRYEVKPYGICTDRGYNYNYLVGLSREANSKEPERIASFRLSNIVSFKSSTRSGRITGAQRKDIEEKILAVGVQFLVQDPEIIGIRLSAKGKKSYERQAHLRPAFRSRKENSDGSWIYEFTCTPLQAQYFFFKYGADAEVLYPASLRENFQKQYEDALSVYTKE